MFQEIKHFQHGPVSTLLSHSLQKYDDFRSIAIGKFLKFEVNTFYGKSGGLQFFSFDTTPIKGVKRRQITICIDFFKIVTIYD